LARICAAVLLTCGLASSPRAEEAGNPALSKGIPAAIPEPELPPDANATAETGLRPFESAPPDPFHGEKPRPTSLQTAAPSAVGDKPGEDETAATPPGKPGDGGPADLVKSDPEGIPAPPPTGGAGPQDVAVTIAALPSIDTHGATVSGFGDGRHTRAGLEAFYASRGYLPVFTDSTGYNAKGRAAIARLNHADDDGLDLSGPAIPDPNEMIDEPHGLAQAEIALAVAIVDYAVQASGGRIDPLRVSPLITAKAAVVDPERALVLVAGAADPDEALGSFNPPQADYRQLREKLANLRAAYPSLAAKEPAAQKPRAEGTAPLIRAKFDLAVVNADQTVRGPKLAAAQLERGEASSTGRRLDASLAEAVSRRGARAVQATILANMEMWRWEPRDMGEERIEVNVPDFSLRVLRGDEILHRARIIVGKPETQTPIFSNAMRYILMNPSWTVPPSIIKKEMLPKLARDPDYLANLGYEVTQRGDTITVKQPPGEDNALGRIAFMFPNEHSVYLHDTPSRSLFASMRRAFSHGCVRVDQPMALAEIVMGPGWSERRLNALVGGDERTLMLPRPVPIHIEYFTAFVDAEGALQLRDDVYGHTRRIESLLGIQS
jgi:L,D-transpeptidase YcbB